jgi:hypothetical protein
VKIIKQGEKAVGTVRFECRSCGCIFEADEGEYECYDVPIVFAKCPCCGKDVSATVIKCSEPKITTRARVLECPECHTLFEVRRGEYREVYREHEGTEFHAGCAFCGHRGAKIIKSWEYVISEGE